MFIGFSWSRGSFNSPPPVAGIVPAEPPSPDSCTNPRRGGRDRSPGEVAFNVPQPVRHLSRTRIGRTGTHLGVRQVLGVNGHGIETPLPIVGLLTERRREMGARPRANGACAAPVLGDEGHERRPFLLLRFIGIHLEDQAQLLQIVRTGRPSGGFARTRKPRKENRGQQANDRDHHQQFYQCKAFPFHDTQPLYV